MRGQRIRLLTTTFIGGIAAFALTDSAAAQDTEARLRQTTSPVTVITEEEIELSGNQTISDVLADLPQVLPGAQTPPATGAFPTVNLRGLGAQRTLVLVDGRRIAPSGLGEVSLGQIPLGLVDRVDVITGGGSALYGSDAVAGVVDIILKRDFQGFEIDGQSNFTDYGAGTGLNLDILWGTNFGGGSGNVTLFGSYFDRGRIGQREFDYSRVSPAFFLQNFDSPPIRVTDPSQVPSDAFLISPGGSDLTPWGTIRSDFGNPFFGLSDRLPGFSDVDLDCNPATSGVDVNGGTLSFDPAGVLGPFRGNGLCGIPLTSIGSSRYNIAPDFDFVSPYEQYNFTGSVRYDFSELVSGSLTGSYTHFATELRSPAAAARDILVPADSPFIPEDLRTALDSRSNPDAPFYISRRFSEVGPRTDDYDYDFFNFRAGLDWNVGPNLTLFTGGGYSRTEQRITIRNAVDPVAVQEGLFDCPGDLSGCTPIDLFGPNSLTPEMADFIRVSPRYDGAFDHFWLSAELRGSLFTLPGGPANFTIGTQYRREGAEFGEETDSFSAGELFGAEPREPLEGHYEVREAFAELRIPIVQDGFIHRLELNGAARYSDYSLDNVGGTWTYSAGAEFAPVRDITFRGNYQRAVRAPNIQDLFAPQRVSPEFYSDPCNSFNSDRNEQACIETGVPDEFLDAFFQLGSTTDAVSGGNPDLEEETADTWTVGAVIQPRFLPRLNITVDYFDIEIANTISEIGTNTILQQCYDESNQAACDRVNRDPQTGQIELIDAGQFNLGRIDMSGIDLQVDYSQPLGFSVWGAGESSLNFFFLGSWIDEFTYQQNNFPDQEPFECGQGFGTGFCDEAVPEFRWTSRLSWTDGPLTTSVRWRHFGHPLREEEEDDFLERIGSYDLFDLAFAFNVNDNLTLNTGVNNLFDAEPALIGNQDRVNTYPGTYDVLGRDFFISANLRF